MSFLQDERDAAARNAAADHAAEHPTSPPLAIVDDRELATILAALRYWAREGLLSSGHERDIATNGDTLKPLTAEEIDALCARLNFGEDERETPDPYESTCAHEWVYTGTAYGGDDERYHGEGRVYCSKCGADGDG